MATTTEPTTAAPAKTAPGDLAALAATLRGTFATGRTRPLAWRREQLRRIEALLIEQEGRLLEALRADLGKCELEGWAGEVGFCLAEVRHALGHLKGWMRPTRVSTPVVNFRGTSKIHYDPLGVVLIIGPWNYPVQLVLSPLVGALAAGNCAVIKPSELAPATARVIGELVPRYLDPECVRVVEGGVPETTALLEQRWDHVFFTGSTRVGKIVYQAAAKHLTPVTLELGGKSPCLVDHDVDLETAARRIAWGKFWNAGQTCVAPDYILVDEARRNDLIAALRETVRAFYGPDPKQSPDYARIVNRDHHARLVRYLDDGKVALGGEHDAEARYVAPTLLTDVRLDAPVMQDEIFGPILPILGVKGLGEAIEFVKARPKPLALYVFTRDGAAAERVLTETTSGGACVNDIMSHLAVPDLPFGGVGDSGIGAYHGPHSFRTFSHHKSVLDRAIWPDLRLRYPPYEGALKWIKKLLA